MLFRTNLRVLTLNPRKSKSCCIIISFGLPYKSRRRSIPSERDFPPYVKHLNRKPLLKLWKPNPKRHDGAFLGRRNKHTYRYVFLCFLFNFLDGKSYEISNNCQAYLLPQQVTIVYASDC